MSYQAAYDATVLDISRLISCTQASVIRVESEMTRPSVLFRPRVFLDGDQWCALYGENIQDGVCGFGTSPAMACEAFDVAWNKGEQK